MICNMVRFSFTKYYRLNTVKYSIPTRKFSFVGLPFTISRQDAERILVNNRGILEESVNNKSTDLTLYDSKRAIRECFIPFHSADIKNIQTTFSGQYGIDHTEWVWIYTYNPSTKSMQSSYVPQTVTNWYSVTGTLDPTDYPFGVTDTQIYAGFKYPRKHIESTLTKSKVIQIDKLTEEMLCNGASKQRRIVYPHDMTISFALEKIFNNVHYLENTRVDKYIRRKYNADHVKISDISVHHDKADIKLKSYHLPAYIYCFDQINSYTGSNVIICKIVDGYTGKYDGDKALSTTKLFLLGSLIGVGAVPLFFGIVPTTALTLGSLIGRMIFGGLLTGIPVSFLGKLRQSYKYEKDKVNANHDDEHNHSFQETDDDIKRCREAEQFNIGNADYNDTNQDRYRYVDVDIDATTKEKLILLNLDSNKLPTEPDLKVQYHIMIKKWHPDTYKGDKIVADKMSSQINNAYNALLLIIRRQQEK